MSPFKMWNIYIKWKIQWFFSFHFKTTKNYSNISEARKILCLKLYLWMYSGFHENGSFSVHFQISNCTLLNEPFSYKPEYVSKWIFDKQYRKQVIYILNKLWGIKQNTYIQQLASMSTRAQVSKLTASQDGKVHQKFHWGQ